MFALILDDLKEALTLLETLQDSLAQLLPGQDDGENDDSFGRRRHSVCVTCRK